MDMKESLQTLRREAEERLHACQTPEALEQALVEILGRSGSLTAILRTMGKLAAEERERARLPKGQRLGGGPLKSAELDALPNTRLKRSGDVTAPARSPRYGQVHPMTQPTAKLRVSSHGILRFAAGDRAETITLPAQPAKITRGDYAG